MKLAAIILSCTILIQSFNFDISDIQKISNLLEHLDCHFEEGDTIDDFIAIHYSGDENAPKTEHEKHQELPFKHQHLDAHSQIVFIVSANEFFGYYQESFLVNTKFTYKEPSTSLFVNKFFQPPQV
jgi:hypothetical protein